MEKKKTNPKSWAYSNVGFTKWSNTDKNIIFYGKEVYMTLLPQKSVLDLKSYEYKLQFNHQTLLISQTDFEFVN